MKHALSTLQLNRSKHNIPSNCNSKSSYRSEGLEKLMRRTNRVVCVVVSEEIVLAFW